MTYQSAIKTAKVSHHLYMVALKRGVMATAEFLKRDRNEMLAFARSFNN